MDSYCSNGVTGLYNQIQLTDNDLSLRCNQLTGASPISIVREHFSIVRLHRWRQHLHKAANQSREVKWTIVSDFYAFVNYNSRIEQETKESEKQEIWKNQDGASIWMDFTVTKNYDMVIFPILVM